MKKFNPKIDPMNYYTLDLEDEDIQEFYFHICNVKCDSLTFGWFPFYNKNDFYPYHWDFEELRLSTMLEF